MHVTSLNTHTRLHTHTHTVYCSPISVAQMETVCCRVRDEIQCCRLNLALRWDHGSPNHKYRRERCAFTTSIFSRVSLDTTDFKSLYSALISHLALARFSLYCIFRVALLLFLLPKY